MWKMSSYLVLLVMLYTQVLPGSTNYQLEIRLLSYMNPGGRTDAGPCCEPDAVLPDGMCLSKDTCDTRFSFQLRNFNRLELIGDPIVVSEFADMDNITFPSCGEIIEGIQNPLVFTFSTSAYNASREFLRVSISISDVDINSMTNEMTVVPIVSPGSMILEIERGSVSTVFSDETLGGAVLTNLALVLQYRLKCTPGSCGEDCTQTTGCTPFPPACPTESTTISSNDSQTEAPTTDPQTVAPTTNPQTEAPSTAPQTEAPTTDSQTARTTDSQTTAPPQTTAAPTTDPQTTVAPTTTPQTTTPTSSPLTTISQTTAATSFSHTTTTQETTATTTITLSTTVTEVTTMPTIGTSTVNADYDNATITNADTDLRITDPAYLLVIVAVSCAIALVSSTGAISSIMIVYRSRCQCSRAKPNKKLKGLAPPTLV